MTSKRKNELIKILKNSDWEKLRAWGKTDPSPFRMLLPLLHNPEAIIRWRAVQAVGKAAAYKAENDIEGVRELIRRLLWSMNDESGNLIRKAPETIAEILVNIPRLADEYAGVLASFLREEPFQRGTHWALARLARYRPEVVRVQAQKLRESLNDPNPHIRAYAAAALRRSGKGEWDDLLQDLTNDSADIQYYDPDEEELIDTSVGEYIHAARREMMLHG